MATAKLSPAKKVELKREILVDVALWFAADCPHHMKTATRREFMKLFDKSIGAAIESDTLKSYDGAAERYLQRQMRLIARKVYGQTIPGQSISERALRTAFNQFITDEGAKALREGRGGTIFCAVYSP